MGPHDMGSTETLTGIWRIVYCLNILMEWGTTVFKKWFDESLMGWARMKAGEPPKEEETPKEEALKGKA